MIAYLDRNRRWLGPAVAGVMFCMASLLPEARAMLPAGLFLGMMVLSALLVGFGSMMTDTVSAVVVRNLTVLLWLGAIGFALFR